MNDMFLPLILSTLGLFLLVKDNKAEKPFKLTLKIEPQAPILVGLGLLGVSLISLIGNFYVMFFLVFGFLYFNDFGGKTKKISDTNFLSPTIVAFLKVWPALLVASIASVALMPEFPQQRIGLKTCTFITEVTHYNISFVDCANHGRVCF